MRRFMRLMGITLFIFGFATTAYGFTIISTDSVWQGNCTLTNPVSITIVDSEFANPRTTVDATIMGSIQDITGKPVDYVDIRRTIAVDPRITWLVLQDEDGSLYVASILANLATRKTYLALTDDLEATLIHSDTGEARDQADWRCGIWETDQNVYRILFQGMNTVPQSASKSA